MMKFFITNDFAPDPFNIVLFFVVYSRHNTYTGPAKKYCLLSCKRQNPKMQNLENA
jgi:hypothetical protein